MKYLKISNKGILEVEALTLLGASTKRGVNGKIGMFGSGNKYALSFLLRNKYEVHVYAGPKRINLSTEPATLREEKFDVITVDGHRTGITTEFGKDWELWQAIRELYCNALDEDGASMEFVNEIEPSDDETHFYIRTRSEITTFISEFDKYFAENRKVLFECKDGKILEKSTFGFSLFRRGIKCMVTDKTSVYDYDLNFVSIDENRLVKYSWEIPSKIWNIIYQCDNKEVIKNILFNSSNADNIECISSDFATLNAELMSDEFKEVLGEIKMAPRGLSGLLNNDEIGDTIVLPTAVFEQVKSKVNNNNLASKFKIYRDVLYRELELDPLKQSTLNNARDFFDECNYSDPFDYPIKAAVFEDKDILGMANLADKTILISEIAFTKGLQTVIETLIEEFIHLKYEVSDETRRFQDSLISEFVTMMKKKNAFLV